MKEGLVQKIGLSLNVTSLKENLQIKPTAEIEGLDGGWWARQYADKMKSQDRPGENLETSQYLLYKISLLLD